MNEIGIFVLGAVQTHLKSHFIPKDLQTTFTRLKAQSRGVRKNNKRASQNVFTSWEELLQEPGQFLPAATCAKAEPKRLFAEVTE